MTSTTQTMISQIDDMINKSKNNHIIGMALDLKHLINRFMLEYKKLKIYEKCYKNTLDLSDIKEWYRMHAGLDQLKDDMASCTKTYYEGKTAFQSEKQYIIHYFKSQILNS
jgi:hypothetical protein